MKFISTKGESEPVSFAEAALRGLAPDGGLYMPAEWPDLPEALTKPYSGKDINLPRIGYEVSRLFIDALDDKSLRNIAGEALNFPAPLVQLDEQTHVLELFHGPTLAFKDFGARYMSRLFSALLRDRDSELVVLVATSGDTGSAVAQGFLGVEGIKVCLLYPAGKVSRIQEQQLTTVGQNVTALEVEGTFDDCQRMVKMAFSDDELERKLMLSSANSINIARLLPQIFYYVYAMAQLDEKGASAPVFSVPSGNFGNLTAGLMAQRMGLPVSGFLAATNVNDVVPEYLKSGHFEPRTSQRTISNAMDVGNPSNFSRILHLFDGQYQKVIRRLWGFSCNDSQTREAIRECYRRHGYIMDPHTAIAYRAAQRYRTSALGYFNESGSVPFIILATAHPAKFRDAIQPVIEHEVEMPERLKACMNREKKSIAMPADYDKLKGWLLDTYEK